MATTRKRKARGLQSAAAARLAGDTPEPNGNGAPPEAASTGSNGNGNGAVAMQERPHEPSGILGALASSREQPPTPEERVIKVPLSQVAPHPKNSRKRYHDLDHLGASISDNGLIQPVVLATREAFIRENIQRRPTVEDELGDAGWVLLAGHRRRAAAMRWGVDTLDAVVRDHLAGDRAALRTIIEENFHREGLTPLEDARMYAQLRDDFDLTEREIADEAHVSPGQVHKRLKLLKLHPELFDVVDDRRITVAAALKLLELDDIDDQLAVFHEALNAALDDARRTKRPVDADPDPATLEVPKARIDTAVEQCKTRIRVREQEAQARDALAIAGIELISSPADILGPNWKTHRLYVKSIDDVDDPADTIATVSSSGGVVKVLYYSKTPPVPDDEPAETFAPASTGSTATDTTPAASTADGAFNAASTGSNNGDVGTAHGREQRARIAAEHERHQAEIRARAEACAQAADARAEACTRMVNGELGHALAAEVLSDMLLTDTLLDTPTEVLATAATWCGYSDLTDTDLQDWAVGQGDQGGLAARRAAVAIALAELEHSVSQFPRNSPWTSREVRHVQRLAANAGYTLTEYDSERIATANRPAAEETAR